MFGYQLVALPYGSNANSDESRGASWWRRINWRATVGAKRLDANRSVVRGLLVNFQFTGNKLEGAFFGWRDSAISGAGQGLTICAVTN